MAPFKQRTIIRHDIIYTILERTDIVQLISEHVQFRKSGIRHVGCCPFHKERTPSFYVFPQTGTYKCFGCGEGGDAIAFVEKTQNMVFTDAVKFLAKRCSVEIEEEQESPEAQQNRLKKEALQIANKNVADFYATLFLQSKEAQAYAYHRWGEDYCKQKGIGYAPMDGHSLKTDEHKGGLPQRVGINQSWRLRFLQGSHHRPHSRQVSQHHRLHRTRHGRHAAQVS